MRHRLFFTRSSPLPPDFSLMEAYLATVEQRLASYLPGKKVYSTKEIDNFERPERFGDLRVLDALLATGILSKEVHKQHKEEGFLHSDGWHDDEDQYKEFITYVVTGSLMKLVEDLKNANDAQPYFISFYSSEGRDAAQALHDALSSASVSGFLSDELQSGDQGRDEMIHALKASRTVFLIESPDYHTRSRCKVERDFAVAKGARILRLLLCSADELKEVPAWLNEEYQYETVKTAAGFQLGSKILGMSLTAKTTDLRRRRRGGMDIIARMTPTQVKTEATKLGLEDELFGNPSDLKNQFSAAAFAADTQADRFCREVDLKPQF